jgi:multidrug resistance efflux pump
MLRLEMAELYGKLRSDVELRAESPDKNSPIVLKDPITGRFYRFTSVQGAVLRSLNGDRTLASIAESVSREFDTPVTEAQVRDFSTKLRTFLLLDEEGCWKSLEAVAKPKRRVIGDLLSIKIHAFNPDALLTRLESRFRFCFTRWFAAIVWSSVGAALVISVLNWESLYLSFASLFSLFSLPLIILVIFVIMTTHEFGHGIALKHFGGKPQEMGFLILYFIPAFYCNVSDAWMLGKRERVLVTLAGGYIQIFLWALATILWRLLAPETLGSRICAIVIAFSGVQALFNFNPLIRLDGYYLLSDMLGVPNLRPRAYGFLKGRLGSLVFGMPEASAGLVRRRERTIYWTYGTASFLFSVALIWVMLERIGGWVVREFQAWGLVIVSAALFMAIPLSGRRPAAAEPEPKRSRWRIGTASRLLIALGVATIIALLPWELKVSGDFVINPEQRLAVSARVAGTLRTILVDEGSQVHKGEILAELQNLELSDEYEESRGELAAKRATLDLLLAGTRPEEIDRAIRLVETKSAEESSTLRIERERELLLDTVAKKQAELDQARTNYERSQKLQLDGLIARNELERDRTEYEVRQKELAEAQGQLRVLDERTDRAWQIKKKERAQAESELNILLAGSRKEAIDVMKAEVAKLEARLGILGQQLEYLSIRSEIDGAVATRYLRNRIGEYLEKGDALCDVVSLGVVKIDMPVPEKEIADVSPGYPITLKVRGYPHRSFEAHVRAIAPVALESDSLRKVVIQGDLENPDGILKPGMTGVGKIRCGRRLIGDLVTRRAIRWLRTEFWEYLP